MGGWWLDSILRAEGSGPYTIRVNGFALTVIDALPEPLWQDDVSFTPNADYYFCHQALSRIGGFFGVYLEGQECEYYGNFDVDFTGFESLPEVTIGNFASGNPQPIDVHISGGSDYILTSPISDAICDEIPEVTERGDPPIAAQLPTGQWVLYDPYLDIVDNTVESPIPDGGGATELATGGATYCANAARTFLNEDQCILSNAVTACGNVPTLETPIVLNERNLLQLLSLTGRYVYAVEGLEVQDTFGNQVPHPCGSERRSRWARVEGACNITALQPATLEALTGLLEEHSGDENPYVRDVFFPETGLACDPSDTDSTIVVLVAGECWRHVHPDHLSVFDMTYWTLPDTHLGNQHAVNNGHPHPITKWADIDGTAILQYPTSHPWLGPGFNHPLTRWDNNNMHFPYIGRLGDTVRYRDLPNELRVDEVATYYNATGAIGGDGVVVCGSPGEVANDPTLGGEFHIALGHDIAWDIGRQREFVWTMTALTAPDQLRLRVAWAMAQWLVLVPSALGDSFQRTEVFLHYYDIFVRNAFGNYRDVLREVSYSPLMAENLSYLQSRSAAYVLEHFNLVSFADENFAREIM